MKKLILLILLSITLSTASFAQEINIEEVESREITDELNGNNPDFWQLGRLGLIQIKIPEDKRLKLTNEIKILLYDSNLNKPKIITHQLDNIKTIAVVKKYFSSEFNKIFILILRPKSNSEIVAFDLENKSFESLKIKLTWNLENNQSTNLNFVSFEGKPHFLIFENKKWFLAEIDFGNEKLKYKELPIFFKNKKIISISKIEDEYFRIIYSYNSNANNMAILDKNMNLIIGETFEIKNKKNYFEIKSMKSKKTEKDLYLSGLFDYDTYIPGIYVIKISNGKFDYTKLYKYTDLKHFYDYLKDEEYTQKLIKAAQKGKTLWDPIKSYVYSSAMYLDNNKLIINFFVYAYEFRTVGPSNEVCKWHNALYFTELDEKSGELIKDREYLLPGNASFFNYELDSFNTITYLYFENEFIKSMTYSDGEIDKGGKFDAMSLFVKNETPLPTAYFNSWYKNYYYTITQSISGEQKKYFIKKYSITEL